MCCVCALDKSKQQYWKDPEHSRDRQKDSRERHREKRIAERRAFRRQNDPGLVERDRERELIKSLVSEAIASGKTTYFYEKPCPNGHTSERFVRDRKCVECNRLACAERMRHLLAKNPKLYERRTRSEEKRKEVAQRKANDRARIASTRRAGSARKEAKAAGLHTYISGRPCKHGHSAPRYTQTGTCIECARIQSASAAKKAYDAVYLKANYSRIVERNLRWRQRNHEAVLAKAVAWTKKNPERRRAISKAYKSRRRAKEREGSSTPELLAWERAARKVCHWCGVVCAKKYEVDHYVPLSKGGRHEVSNLVIACPPCNRRKSAKDPYEFAKERGRLF